MHSTRPHLLVLMASAVLLLASAAGCRDNPVHTEPDLHSPPVDELDLEADGHLAGPPVELADAEAFFEFNTTDDDLGLQIFLDGEGWNRMRVFAPDRRPLVHFAARGELATLGITELRFESAEPSPAEVLAKFPPGVYRFRGRSVDGQRLTGAGELSHDFLPPPVFSPADGVRVDPDDVTVRWRAPRAELVEVILESDSDAVFDVIVEGDVHALDVPPQFLRPGTEYKIELLAYAENGNRTIAESFFWTTRDRGDDDETDDDD